MNQKKWGLIDDDIIIGLFYNFEVEDWSNKVMKWWTDSRSNASTPSL
jgi:hypothetical protein